MSGRAKYLAFGVLHALVFSALLLLLLLVQAFALLAMAMVTGIVTLMPITRWAARRWLRRCDARFRPTGDRCILLNDHDGPHHTVLETGARRFWSADPLMVGGVDAVV